MSILGYDCDGKPIRAGDRFVYCSTNPSTPSLIGHAFTAGSSAKLFSKRYGEKLNFICAAGTNDIFLDAVTKKLDQDQPTIPWSECVWKPKAVTA